MDKFQQLLDLVNLMEVDYKKFHQQNNREAGTRLRKQLQEIRALAKSMRNDIQETRQHFAPKIQRTKK